MGLSPFFIIVALLGYSAEFDQVHMGMLDTRFRAKLTT